YHTNQTDTQKALLTSPANAPPSSEHPLGTDPSGFDMLGRIMYGGQISLIVGFAAAAIATVVGVLVGAVSGFFGSFTEAFLMRIVDVLLSGPLLYLLIVLAVIFHPSVEILTLVIGFTAWLVPARLVRGETLSLRGREFVQAGRGMGRGCGRGSGEMGGEGGGTGWAPTTPNRTGRSSSTRRSRSLMRSFSSPRSA